MAVITKDRAEAVRYAEMLLIIDAGSPAVKHYRDRFESQAYFVLLNEKGLGLNEANDLPETEVKKFLKDLFKTAKANLAKRGIVVTA